MVVVVFSAGRRLIFFDGKSACRLNPGVEIYNATSSPYWCSSTESIVQIPLERLNLKTVGM